MKLITHHLIEAIVNNDLADVIKKVIDDKIDVTADNNEAIKRACYEGNLDIVKFLIAEGADYHVETEMPLFLATIRRNESIVQYLMSKSAEDMGCLDHLKNDTATIH